MIDATLNYVVNSIYLGKNVSLCTTLKYLIWDSSTTLRTEADQVGQTGDNALHYIHFEIIGDPCILIGSHWYDLFVNRTIFALKRVFVPANEEYNNQLLA